MSENNEDYIVNIKTVQSGAFRVLVEALKEILTDTNIIFDERHYYKPVPGSVIIFPASLEHCVERENSNITRITMAYNFNMNNKSEV